jgi:AcrR family transcriptional regulator
MTDISVASETSPGGLYRYFSDKASVARALLAEYDEQLELRWIPILASAGQMPVRLMVTTLLDEVSTFSAECPAFLVLLAAPIKYRRDKEAKNGLRARLSEAFIAIAGSNNPPDALVISNVFVETVKGMLSMFSQEPAEARPMIVAHYKCLLTAYLENMSLAWKEPLT